MRSTFTGDLHGGRHLHALNRGDSGDSRNEVYLMLNRGRNRGKKDINQIFRLNLEMQELIREQPGG
jgi:hypothetical protein